jgi:glycosyltransferase involved in cell wall biosynthesis
VRVTHVVHEFEGGGLETLVAAMARGMDPRRVSTSVISMSGSIGRLGAELESQLRDMVAIKPVPLVSLVAPVGLARAIRRTNAEVVHIHSGVWLKAALAARLARVRGVVFTEHGREHDDPAAAQWMDRRAAQMTDRVVAVSARLGRYLHEQVGITQAQLTTIENGIDTTRFSPGPPRSLTRAALGIPNNALVVGSVGRLEPVKAYDRVLRAVRHVVDSEDAHQPIYVLLCGDGSQREPLRELARSLGLESHVILPGWLPDPADAYRMMDVFVLPSISEGLSVSLLEAMSTGIAPLVTPVGANSDVLRDGLAQQVVPAEDIAHFGTALGELTGSTARRNTLATAARAAVVDRFSQTRMLESYMTLYEQLARRSSGAKASGGRA